MAGRAYFQPDDQQCRLLDTSDPEDRDLVRSYAEREKVPRGTFQCEISSGAMFAKRRGPTVFLSHYPGEGHGNCIRIVFGMSEEHKREQEYWARAAAAAGYDTHTEYRTSNHTVLDVAIDGPQRVGIEVQRSKLPPSQVKARTTKSRNAGWQAIWSDNLPKNASWANQVPTVRPGRIDWSDPNPPPRTARAIGPRRLHVVRCGWDIRGIRCRRPCSKLHAPEFESIDGLTIDDVAELAPAGELVPLQHRDAVYLVPPESYDRYQDLLHQGGASSSSTGASRRSSTRTVRNSVCESATHGGSSLTAPEWTQSPDVQCALRFVKANSADYSRNARIAGCNHVYPQDNICSQCGQVSADPLIPWPSGWRCGPCTYA